MCLDDYNIGIEMITITEDEYKQACDDYQGICLACEEYQDNCEPDAEGYLCESCGENQVCGVEQALIMGELDIT
jgi:hypothetical protein